VDAIHHLKSVTVGRGLHRLVRFVTSLSHALIQVHCFFPIEIFDLQEVRAVPSNLPNSVSAGWAGFKNQEVIDSLEQSGDLSPMKSIFICFNSSLRICCRDSRNCRIFDQI
jgi:hypothetical protein